MTTETDSLAHLNADVRAVCDLPDLVRAERMFVDRFIEHERLTPILKHIDHLRLMPVRVRAHGLVVSGVPGSGKTMLARAVMRRAAAAPASAVAAATQPVVSISMTGAREAKHIFERLLRALGCPSTAPWRGSDREEAAMRLLRDAQVRLLLVDEIQDILTSTTRQQQIALDVLKHLMNELSLPLVVLGTKRATKAMEVDDHLKARFKFRELPVWKRDDYLVNFLTSLEAHLPLKLPSNLSSLPMMEAILKLSKGVLDPMVTMITSAAAHAVERGIEKVTPALLELAMEQPPEALMRREAERRKAA